MAIIHPLIQNGPQPSSALTKFLTSEPRANPWAPHRVSAQPTLHTLSAMIIAEAAIPIETQIPSGIDDRMKDGF